MGEMLLDFVRAGEVKRSMLFEPYMPFEIPYTLIRGKKEGPTAVISAGMHCAEFVGIQSVIELSEELQPENLRGTVVLLPLLNRSGFEHRTMSTVYEDGRNLNRVFPGNPHGTASERLAYAIYEHFIQNADAYVDLHSGDGYEKLIPFSYYVAGNMEAATKALADHCNTRYNVCSRFTNGGAYNVACGAGIPAILLERGSLSLMPRVEIDADKADVYNILRYLGILQGEAIHYEKQNLENVHFFNAPETGCWYPALEPGSEFTKGTLLGRIRDYWGNTLSEITAEANGILLYETYSLNIIKNTPMIAYAMID